MILCSSGGIITVFKAVLTTLGSPSPRPFPSPGRSRDQAALVHDEGEVPLHAVEAEAMVAGQRARAVDRHVLAADGAEEPGPQNPL